MKTIEFKRLMSLLGGLSASECIEAQAAIRDRTREVESDVVLRQVEQQVTSCPHCIGLELRSAGSKDGRKRFKCMACSKTFNAYTGTPLARLKMAEKHIEHADLMVEGWSLRKVAEKLSIDLKTAFLWRHRFLQTARNAQPAKLSGVVEADETFFLESFKGQKAGIPRPSKTRGEPAKQRGLSREQIPVLVARDRSTGATLTAKLQDRSSKQIGACLVPVLDKDVILCSDGASAYRTIGRLHGLDVKSIPAKASAGNYHVNNVNAYDSRLKSWVFRFRGIATKYLDNYLGWHRMLDRDGKNASGRAIVSSLLSAALA